MWERSPYKGVGKEKEYKQKTFMKGLLKKRFKRIGTYTITR
jgi:hypothetical protein